MPNKRTQEKLAMLPLKVKIEMLDRIRLGVNESTYIKECEDKIRNSIASISISAKTVRDPAVEKNESSFIIVD